MPKSGSQDSAPFMKKVSTTKESKSRSDIFCTITLKNGAARSVSYTHLDVYKRQGVDRAISATYMLAHYIEQASVIEDLVRVMPLENQKVLVNEIKVNSDCPVVDRRIADMELPFNTIISCIIRETEVIVPNGQNKIMAGDRLVVITTPQSQKESVKAILGSEDNE